MIFLGVCGADSTRGQSPGAPTFQTDTGELAIFPADNPWNQPIEKLPVHPRSAAFIDSIGRDKPLHPDFGTVYNGAPSGIPFCIARRDQKRVPVKFDYADESDPGPYPIPDDAPIEGGSKSDGDRHVLVLDPHEKKLYELFRAFKTAEGWRAGSGAVFDFTSNKLRRAGWTSADGAGLPIFPGLVRYDEAVENREIRHALRVTVEKTQRGYISPARNWASTSNDPIRPPMGLRLRLKSSFDTSRFPHQVQAILKALKTYGLIVADNGGNWFITGAPDPRWNDDNLHTLRKVLGRDLEAVDTGPIVTK
jgi:hypothetical protein